MASTAPTADTFTRWALGLMASALVAGGGAMVSILWTMREDVTEIKTSIFPVSKQVDDHETRIRTLERPNTDNTGTRDGVQTWRPGDSTFRRTPSY